MVCNHQLPVLAFLAFLPSSGKIWVTEIWETFFGKIWVTETQDLEGMLCWVGLDAMWCVGLGGMRCDALGWDAMWCDAGGGLYEVGYKLLVLLAACCRPTAIRRHRLFTTTGDTLPLVQGEEGGGASDATSPSTTHPPIIPPPHPTLTQPNHPTPHISQQPHPHYSSLQETRWSSSSLSWLNFTKTLLLLLLMMILWIRKLCTK